MELVKRKYFVRNPDSEGRVDKGAPMPEYCPWCDRTVSFREYHLSECKVLKKVMRAYPDRPNVQPS